MRRPGPGLRTAVTAAFAGGSLLVSLLLAISTYVVARHYLIEQRERNALQQAYADAALVKDGLRTKGANVSDVLGVIAQPARTTVYIHRGGEWYASDLTRQDHAATRRVAQVVEHGQVALSWTRATGGPAVIVGIPLAGMATDYYEASAANELDDTLRTLRTALWVCALVTTLAGGLLGRYAARGVLRPLNQVAGAAARISAGDLATRLDETDDPDLATLSGSFNTMVDTVVERLDHDARFAADVSHELRTPLATLTTSLGYLDDAPELSERSRLAVDLMGHELDRFRRALDDLIALGRLDAGVRESERETLPVTTLIEEALRESGVRHRVEAVDADVHVDRLQLRRALANLVRNAEVHGGGLSAVRVVERGSLVDIHVEDDGPGVPAAERERVFDRFARLGSRGSTTGSGLGLSIVRQTAQAHGGAAWCRGRLGGGADFVLTLPRVAAP